jgi:8-oxo-dGTP pyrophosphatase MutT (NUDIX family)
MHDQFHEVQSSILRELIFKNGSNFAALNAMELTTDHFSFHIRQLQKEKLIFKENGKYFLTNKGKMVAGMLDTDSLKLEKTGKPSIAVTAKKIEDGQEYILMQKRTKEPFFGYWGFVNGKIRFGETSAQTAQRELEEETGISGNLKHLCVFHKLRGPDENTILLDNFFFIYIVHEPLGTIKNTPEGENVWCTFEQAKTLSPVFPGFEDVFTIVINEETPPYQEKHYQVENI